MQILCIFLWNLFSIIICAYWKKCMPFLVTRYFNVALIIWEFHSLVLSSFVDIIAFLNSLECLLFSLVSVSPNNPYWLLLNIIYFTYFFICINDICQWLGWTYHQIEHVVNLSCYKHMNMHHHSIIYKHNQSV